MAEVLALQSFLRKAKKFASKFPTLPDEIEELAASLRSVPAQGVHLGAGLFKIRLASNSNGKGKSGGFRVITYYLQKTEEGEIVYLVTIYDKSEEAAISKTELKEILARHLG